MNQKAKIHGWNGNKVDCQLYHMNSTRDVFWSPSKNSYVLVYVREDNAWRRNPDAMASYYWQASDGKWFFLASINGGGEIRWDVSKDRLESALRFEKNYPDHNGGDGAEFLLAARHFGLVNPKGWEAAGV